MKQTTGLILAVLLAVGGQIAGAAEIKVANVAIAGDGVQFDISWTHSWRASWKEGSADISNWDAAWVFVKYRAKGDAAWRHATLSAKNSDHSAPKGSTIDVGVTGDRGMGVSIQIRRW